MSTKLLSLRGRRSRVAIAAILAGAMGACGSDVAPTEQGNATEMDELQGSTTAGVSPRVANAAPSPKAHKRDAHEKMAAKAVLQIPPQRVKVLKTELQLGELDTLRPINAQPRESGDGSVRYAHYHQGLRVLGSSVIVHTDQDGNTRSVTSSLRSNIRISTSPTLDREQAIAAVMADPERFPYREDPEVELAILPLEEQVVKATQLPPKSDDLELNADELESRLLGHQLIYVVETDEEDPGASDPIRKMRYHVDAHTGKILKQHSLKRHSAATNFGLSMYRYPSSSTAFTNRLLLDTSYDSPWFDPYVYRWVMEDTVKNFYVQDHDSSWWYGANNLYSGDWGDGMPFAGDDTATTLHRQTSMVDVKWALQATWQMFDRVFARQGVDDDYYDVNAHVHYGVNYNDAHYDSGNGNIYVGDGATRTSLDTVAHEFGHAFDDFTAGLLSGSNGETAGLSEANADIIGVMTNYYVYNLGVLNNQSIIPDGQHSVNTGANFVDYWWMFNGRNFRNPKYPYYYSGIGNTDEHDALGPMVAAFFFLARGASANTSSDSFSYLMPWGTDGIGIHDAARIWYRAMAYHFSDTTTYSNADDALIQAAKDLFGNTQPEQPEVVAVRNAMAAANFATKASSYEMPPTYYESEPNDSQSQINWVPKPLDSSAPAGKPIRKEIFGSAGTNAVDWYQVWVPDGYALKISLLPTWGNDHDISAVYETGSYFIGKSENSGSAADVVRIPYVENAPSGHKSYNISVTGYNSGTSGAYHLYLDWIPYCSDAASSVQAYSTTMAGCAGSVAWSNRESLCGEGSHVCSAQEWVDRRGSSIPSHNYWTDDDLLYSGTGTNSCTASVDTGTSCNGNPMRVCAPTQTDPEGNNCNWTSCGLDSTSNLYFGGCVDNTTAGTLCCFD